MWDSIWEGLSDSLVSLVFFNAIMERSLKERVIILSHLTRKTTEARSRTSSEWTRSHVCRERRYRPPPGGRLRKGLGKVRKELAGRFYQLLSGHAATAPHLRRIGQAPSDRCWWCGSGERQTRYHLFIRCRWWTPEIRRLWQGVGGGCEWESPRAPSVRLLFRGVCVISYLLTATCGPKGHGSGLPLPSRAAAEFYQPISCPRSK